MNAARGVVFDLDGTVIDSLPDLTAALNRSLARHDVEPVPRAEVAPMVGDGARMLLRRGYAARGMEPTAEDEAIFLADYEAHVTDLTEAFPGVPEALAAFERRGYVLGMCTNKPEASAWKVLEALDLARFFQVLIGGDATDHRKPDPRHLRAVLDAMTVGPAHAVMVGDHRNDIAAAEGLGVASIFVTWGYGKAAATVIVDTAASLVPAVEGLLGRG